MDIGRVRGVIPPATTPFDERGAIRFDAAAKQIDWLAGHDIGGIAVGGSTGEGHTLGAEEYRDLIAAAIDAAAGRAPIIAGIITDSTQDAVSRGKLVRDMAVAALQVTPVHYLFRPDDEAMLEHFRTLADETGMPILIYNVVPWAYLSPQLLVRIMREVPNVTGVKQSAGDMKLFADLMIMADPDHLIFSAVDALLYPCYALGAQGSIAAILSAAPGPSVELWEAVKAGDHARAKTLHEGLLKLWNAMPLEILPACVKHAQTLQGIPGLRTRAPMSAPDAAAKAAIQAALEGIGVALQTLAAE